MPRKARGRSQSPSILIESFQPFLSLIAIAGGFVVWTYSTFAQINHVEKIYTELRDNQRIILQDAHSYSDSNREKTLLTTLDLKESVKDLRDEVKALENKLVSIGGIK